MIRGEGAGSARGGRPGVPASRGGCSGPPRPLATAPARWQAGHFQCSLPPPAACPGLRPVRWHRRREGYAPTPLLFHEREDNPPGAERRSAGARRWLRADGSGTSKSPHQIPGGFKKFAAICPNRAAALCRGPRGAHGLPRDKLSRSQPRRAPSPAPAPPVRALGAAAETDGSLRRPPRPPRTLHRARHPPAQRPAEENKNVCRL
ncbi:uncharacterized protein [Patagioenas fasciata]|uniref:uncharacterized protein isoform X2 n=1 Tax=Patagioenas fasciata TaxID=372321 RepID=UPI003A99FEBE